VVLLTPAGDPTLVHQRYRQAWGRPVSAIDITICLPFSANIWKEFYSGTCFLMVMIIVVLYLVDVQYCQRERGGEIDRYLDK
jgi:hypothetical protein